MRQLLIIPSIAAILVGCDHNEFTITNQGAKTWQQIEIKAGGRDFTIKQLEGGATESFRFTSQAEGGGEITGTLEANRHEAEFGYFTPNLSTENHIILTDDGTIEILDRP